MVENSINFTVSGTIDLLCAGRQKIIDRMSLCKYQHQGKNICKYAAMSGVHVLHGTSGYFYKVLQNLLIESHTLSQEDEKKLGAIYNFFEGLKLDGSPLPNLCHSIGYSLEQVNSQKLCKSKNLTKPNEVQVSNAYHSKL